MLSTWSSRALHDHPEPFAGHPEPFAVILRSAAVLSGAKELLFIKQMPRIRSAQAPDLLVPAQDRLREGPALSIRSVRSLAAAGFTLIELIIVISIMLILLSIAAPIYRTSVIRSKEAVLRDNLFTMRALIDQYTVDKQEAPQSLQDLVTAGYLRDVPMDPFTGANNTWEEIFETDVVMNPDQTTSGITDVHSGSSLRSLAGDIYSSW